MTGVITYMLAFDQVPALVRQGPRRCSTRNGLELDNSGQRIVVDPVTRIEGHMRREVNLDIFGGKNPHWYSYQDETKGLHPWDGVTEPNYELGSDTKGTGTRIEAIDENAKYSWIKAPRWRGHAMEVGPLSRYIGP